MNEFRSHFDFIWPTIAAQGLDYIDGMRLKHELFLNAGYRHCQIGKITLKAAA